jgi:phage terminase small subunit
MPILQNPRHETFAQELAMRKTADEAYETAGYKPSRPHACRLATKGNVRARIAELQAAGAEKAALTVESLIGEAEEARVLAMTLKLPGAAVSAIIAKAKLAGKLVEKRETENTFKTADRLTDAELEAIASGQVA